MTNMTNSDENRIKAATAKLDEALAILEHVSDSKDVLEEYELIQDLVRALTYKLEK